MQLHEISMRPDGLEQNYYFGGGTADTFLTPAGMVILVLACLFILFLRRKYVIAPFLVASLFIPVGQVIVVAGAHLMIYRVLVLVLCCRIFWGKLIARQDPFSLRMNPLDKVFLAWALCNAIFYTVLWHDVGAFFNRLGFLYTALGVYFALRYVIRDREDLIRTIKALALAAVPIAVAMYIEHQTGNNVVSTVFGGVRTQAVMRGSSIRAQGPFQHSIVAGTFGAMLLPLFIGLWKEGRKHRLIAALGILSSGAITIASASSTPMMTLLTGIAAWALWPFRKKMRILRWGFVITLICLQFVMKAPVWFLIARMSSLTGGTGWHRAELIDQFIRHFGEWWLIGTQNNANWGLDMWDSINAFVNAGVEGGLVTFVFFVSIFVYAYKRLGIARRLAENDPPDEHLMWALGCCLFSNTVAFFGITYFDQSVIVWYALLVMISVGTTCIIQKEESESEASYALASGSVAVPRLARQETGWLPNRRARPSPTRL